MLHIKLIVLGNLKEAYWRDAVAEYEKRLSAFAKVEIAELKEYRVADAPSPAEIETALEIAPDWRLIVSGQPILDTVVAVSHDEERGVCMRKWNSGRCELFFSSRSFTPTAWGSLGSLHLGKCYLSLPVSLRDAIVQGGCRDHLFMGGNVSGSDLVFTVASGEAFTGTSEISASLFVCGMTEN